MSREIRVYVEGGGDGKDTKANFRKGFGEFLRSLREMARSGSVRWNLIACGSRENAFRDFGIALKTHPQAINILLVDSEGPVTAATRWDHLNFRDGWVKPSEAEEQRCHLMVQAMEAWFLADLDVLKAYYGRGFNPNPIPKHTDVETIPKDRLEFILKEASRGTSKGEYHKIRHGCKLLERVDPVLVRSHAHHCETLFSVIEDLITVI